MRKSHRSVSGSGRKEVFLSSTYSDLKDLRTQIADFLGRRGMKVIRSEDADFPRSSGAHRHDICLKRVNEMPNFLLVVDGRAGKPYSGAKREYRGLTITHAEAREAFKKRRGWNCFVRHDVLTKYEVWAHNKRREDIEFEGVDKKVFLLLDEIEGLGKWNQIFDNPKDLMASLKKLFRV